MREWPLTTMKNLPEHTSLLGVYYALPALLPYARALADSLHLPLLDQPPELLPRHHFVVVLDHGGCSLCFTGKGSPGPVKVDFLSGATAYRRRYGGGRNQLIARAVGVKPAFKPRVLDLTAGLGQDAFVLATLGCSVTMVERVPVIHQLLADGLKRAEEQGDLALRAIIRKMSLHHCQASGYLDNIHLNSLNVADVIYFDPMFPTREKSAGVKKPMMAFKAIVGNDDDAGQVLAKALTKARYRVVVKRPRLGPGIDQIYPGLSLPSPDYVLPGKSGRFDIYALARMPVKG